jgi:hypothetical protein
MAGDKTREIDEGFHFNVPRAALAACGTFGRAFCAIQTYGI